MFELLHCPKCDRIIISPLKDGGYKVRTRMLLFPTYEQAKAICPTCKERVTIPIYLKEEYTKI